MTNFTIHTSLPKNLPNLSPMNSTTNMKLFDKAYEPKSGWSLDIPETENQCPLFEMDTKQNCRRENIKNSISRKNGKLSALFGLTIFLMGTPIAIIFIIRYQERAYWVDKFHGYSNEIRKIKEDMNATQIQLKNATVTLKHVLEMLDDIVGRKKQYEKIGQFGHFIKLSEIMNFHDGQRMCRKNQGQIVEFDERIPNFKDKLAAVMQKFGKHDFFVGLNDQERENVWRWSSSGRILTHSVTDPWDDGEPNNVESEDCAIVQAINLFLIDVKCSTRSNIICEKVLP